MSRLGLSHVPPPPATRSELGHSSRASVGFWELFCLQGEGCEQQGLSVFREGCWLLVHGQLVYREDARGGSRHRAITCAGGCGGLGDTPCVEVGEGSERLEYT